MKKALILLLSLVVVLALGCQTQQAAEPQVDVQPVEEPEPAPAEVAAPAEAPAEAYEPSPLQPVDKVEESAAESGQPTTSTVDHGRLRRGRIDRITSKRREMIHGKIKDLETTRVHRFSSPLMYLHSNAIVTFTLDDEGNALDVQLEAADEDKEDLVEDMMKKTGGLEPEPGFRIMEVKVEGVQVRRGPTYHTHVKAIVGSFDRFNFETDVQYERNDVLFVKLDNQDTVVEHILKE